MEAGQQQVPSIFSGFKSQPYTHASETITSYDRTVQALTAVMAKLKNHLFEQIREQIDALEGTEGDEVEEVPRTSNTLFIN